MTQSNRFAMNSSRASGRPAERPRAWLTTLTLIVVLAWRPVTAMAQPEDGAATCTDDAIVVFDASGSMQRLAYSGETRLTLARAAARTVIPAAAQVRRLGLIVYGPGPSSRCANITLRVPPTNDAAGQILAEIEATATGGETPLTAAVESAADVLSYRSQPGTVVLITDGDENCGGDPCAAGRRLAHAAAGLKVHVISFRIGTIPRFRAACLAEETGGLFVPTDTLEELTEALKRVLVCPRISKLEPSTHTKAFKGNTAPATSR